MSYGPSHSSGYQLNNTFDPTGANLRRHNTLPIGIYRNRLNPNPNPNHNLNPKPNKNTNYNHIANSQFDSIPDLNSRPLNSSPLSLNRANTTATTNSNSSNNMKPEIIQKGKTLIGHLAFRAWGNLKNIWATLEKTKDKPTSNTQQIRTPLKPQSTQFNPNATSTPILLSPPQFNDKPQLNDSMLPVPPPASEQANTFNSPIRPTRIRAPDDEESIISATSVNSSSTTHTHPRGRLSQVTGLINNMTFSPQEYQMLQLLLQCRRKETLDVNDKKQLQFNDNLTSYAPMLNHAQTVPNARALSVDNHSNNSNNSTNSNSNPRLNLRLPTENGLPTSSPFNKKKSKKIKTKKNKATLYRSRTNIYQPKPGGYHKSSNLIKPSPMIESSLSTSSKNQKRRRKRSHSLLKDDLMAVSEEPVVTYAFQQEPARKRFRGNSKELRFADTTNAGADVDSSDQDSDLEDKENGRIVNHDVKSKSKSKSKSRSKKRSLSDIEDHAASSIDSIKSPKQKDQRTSLEHSSPGYKKQLKNLKKSNKIRNKSKTSSPKESSEGFAFAAAPKSKSQSQSVNKHMSLNSTPSTSANVRKKEMSLNSAETPAKIAKSIPKMTPIPEANAIEKRFVYGVAAQKSDFVVPVKEKEKESDCKNEEPFGTKNAIDTTLVIEDNVEGGESDVPKEKSKKGSETPTKNMSYLQKQMYKRQQKMIKEYTKRFNRVYAKYNPTKLDSVPSLVQKYRYKLHELYDRVCLKYNLRPCIEYDGQREAPSQLVEELIEITPEAKPNETKKNGSDDNNKPTKSLFAFNKSSLSKLGSNDQFSADKVAETKKFSWETPGLESKETKDKVVEKPKPKPKHILDHQASRSWDFGGANNANTNGNGKAKQKSPPKKLDQSLFSNSSFVIGTPAPTAKPKPKPQPKPNTNMFSFGNQETKQNGGDNTNDVDKDINANTNLKQSSFIMPSGFSFGSGSGSKKTAENKSADLPKSKTLDFSTNSQKSTPWSTGANTKSFSTDNNINNNHDTKKLTTSNFNFGGSTSNDNSNSVSKPAFSNTNNKFSFGTNNTDTDTDTKNKTTTQNSFSFGVPNNSNNTNSNSNSNKTQNNMFAFGSTPAPTKKTQSSTDGNTNANAWGWNMDNNNTNNNNNKNANSNQNGGNNWNNGNNTSQFSMNTNNSSNNGQNQNASGFGMSSSNQFSSFSSPGKPQNNNANTSQYSFGGNNSNGSNGNNGHNGNNGGGSSFKFGGNNNNNNNQNQSQSQNQNQFQFKPQQSSVTPNNWFKPSGKPKKGRRRIVRARRK